MNCAPSEKAGHWQSGRGTCAFGKHRSKLLLSLQRISIGNVLQMMTNCTILFFMEFIFKYPIKGLEG